MRYYITTAIDYVNSIPHLGTAYEKMTADVIARHRRGRGDDVLFLMGNDEHSIKVAQAAEQQGLDPLVYCDQMEEKFRAAWSTLLVEPDDFIRTSQDRHKVAVTEIVNRIHAKGDLFQGTYEGWYCEGCEAFKKEDELVDGKCPDHPTREPKWLEETNWFFKLSKYEDALKKHYAEHPEFLVPDFRRNEMLALLERGLEDVSVSRSSQSWGVPFPFDESAVVYVWFDALINYIAGAGFPRDTASFEKWWPADLHLIGKDITRFHCVIWPAMLMSADIPLPKSVFAHGFVNMGGDRMSKSAGLRADPAELAAEYGPDAIRYYVCREVSFGHDVEYTEERIRTRITTELANGLGNLASRTLAMLVKYRGGEVGPAPAGSRIVAAARDAVKEYEERMDRLDLRGGIEAAMGVVDEANAHVDRTAPFQMAKDPSQADALQGVLAELANSLLIASCLLYPFMPGKMKLLQEALLGEAVDPTRVIRDAATIAVPADRVVAKGPPLFPRLEEKKA